MKANINKQAFKRMSELAALLLWEAGAIKVNLDKPFKLVSGNYSPIYINCRCVISSPIFMQIFNAIAQYVLKQNKININIIAGGETAGIPFAAFLANALSFPMVYVRKAKKGYGISNLVEGVLSKNAKVLLVEDLITDGGSKIGFIEGIKDAGAVVKHTLVLFDRLQGGSEVLAKEGVHLYKITDIDTVLRVAELENLLPRKQVDIIREYLMSPKDWHMQRGLDFL